MNELAAIPEPPSKWSIVPIHTSDREVFKSCRRKWSWSSPSQANLIRRPSIYGIIMPLWFGTGIHQSLQRSYSVPAEDPVLAFESWFSLEVDGGAVKEEDLKEYPDRNPVLRPDLGPDVYYVSGLKEILPDYDPEIFEEHRQLGIGMMTYYKDYAAREDNFKVIALEHDFSIPVLDPDGQPLYKVDTRVMPEDWEPDYDTENMYGPLMKEPDVIFESDLPPGIYKQVHARGRMDMILQDNESGRYGIKDYKTAGTIGDDYFRHLDLDEQCTSYLWAAQREAEMYDLPYKTVDFIIYEALRKAYPSPPTPLKNGLPSLDRQKESCTARMFEQYVKENNLDVWFNTNDKAQSYYAYLLDMGDRLFIQRGAPGQPYIFRNDAQKKNAGLRLYLESMDMLAPNLSIYPNPTKAYSCLNCVFRGPCVAKEAGHDWESMLEDGFISNYDR